MLPLETTLITGASEGLGYEFSELLAAKHHNLILVARNQEKLIAMQSSLEKRYPIRVHVLPKDLSDKNAVAELIGEIEKLNVKLTSLINNVGIGAYGSFTDIDSEKDLQMIQLNIFSLVELTRYAVTKMKKNNHGKILNVASLLAFFPMPLFSVYAATKAFVLSFSEALNKELKGTNISVTCLCPGPINTKFTANSEMGQSRAYQILTQSDPKRVAKSGIKAMIAGKRTIVFGFKNNLLVFSTRLAPRGIVLMITNALSKPKN
jgi:uncharacterized protein